MFLELPGHVPKLITGLATVEHSLWTAPEDESDFTLREELVKHVPIGNAE